jgi:ABC-type Fe3+ transport system substrate-binding protein
MLHDYSELRDVSRLTLLNSIRSRARRSMGREWATVSFFCGASNRNARPQWRGIMIGCLRLSVRLAARASAIVVVVTASSCTAPAATEISDQLYALAKAEKILVIWAANPSAALERAARAFEQKFPAVTVSLVSGMRDLNVKIKEQVRAKKVVTDLVILHTVQDFVAWNISKLLLHFKPDGFDKINALSKDRDGAWMAVTTNPIFYGYNTESVRPEEVPKSAVDFLKRQFKGKIISVHPTYNDAALYVFGGIVRQYGWGYMDHYMKQQPVFVQDQVGVARSLGSGESLVSFDNGLSSTLDVQRAGGRISLAGPTDDFLPVFFNAEAILKDAPHPNAAKLFVTWFFSKEWQSRSGDYSARLDVQAPAELPSLSKYRLMDRYLEFVTDGKLLADLRKRFETYTGPATNIDGLK